MAYLIGRLVIDMLGYFLAAIIAGLFLTIALYLQADNALAADDRIVLAIFAPIVTFISAGSHFLLAVLVIVIGELWAIRSLFYYVLAGAALGPLQIILTSWLNRDVVEGVPALTALVSRENLVVILATGMVAGFVFWLIAGRHAGWQRPWRVAADV